MRDSRTHSRIFQLDATRFAVRPPAKSNSIAAIRSPPPSFVLFGNIIERLQKSGTHARPEHPPPVYPRLFSLILLPRSFPIQPSHLELKRRDSSLSFPLSSHPLLPPSVFSSIPRPLCLSYFLSSFRSLRTTGERLSTFKECI